MFTNTDKLFAVAATAGLLFGAVGNAQESPLPRPPLQPMPKEFQVPRPKLSVPDVIPVAQQSEPPRSFGTNPLPPERRYLPPPELGHEKSSTLPEKGTAVGGQTAKETAGQTRVTGKVVRVDKDRVAIETNVGAAMVLYVDPKTEYLQRRAADLVPGASFALTYEKRGDRLWITAVDILDRNVTPATEPVAPPAPVYDTEIVRVVGPGQIIVRNAAGVEFPVYVTGDTRYVVGDTTAAFADLRAGMRIRLVDELRAERHFARQILGR